MCGMESRSPMAAPYRSSDIEAAVIGAGPYGLAVAAHLKAAGVSTLVFGEPMSFWDRHMPKGMRLRSPHRASHIADPDHTLSLDHYAAASGGACGEQLPVEIFIDYGTWFQQRAIPDLDRRKIKRVKSAGPVFRLTLDDGDSVAAERVIVATGLANQEFRPQAFSNIPAQLASHTCEHTSFDAFRGKRVAVIGRGQSACESAALLAEAGAEVDLIFHGAIRWLGDERGGLGRKVKRRIGQLLETPSAVGPFPYSWLAEFPALIHHLPPSARAAFNQRCLAAGAASWLLPRFGDVIVTSARAILKATPRNDKIVLQLDGRDAAFDHVLLGTGYKIDLAKFDILVPELRSAIVCDDGSPRLATGLESSVPGLHFAGAAAVTSFGPLMRFVAGTSFAAKSIARMSRTRGSKLIPTAANASRLETAQPARRL